MQVVYQLLKEVAYQRDKEHGRAAPKHDYHALLRMLTATGQNQGSVMVCRLARTRMTAVKTLTMAIS